MLSDATYHLPEPATTSGNAGCKRKVSALTVSVWDFDATAAFDEKQKEYNETGKVVYLSGKRFQVSG